MIIFIRLVVTVHPLVVTVHRLASLCQLLHLPHIVKGCTGGAPPQNYKGGPGLLVGMFKANAVFVADLPPGTNFAWVSAHVCTRSVQEAFRLVL